MEADFVHIGMTVSDLERSIEFYSKWFGFEKQGGTRFPPEFFQAADNLYQLPDDVYCDMAMISSKDQKCTIELFQFSNVEATGTKEWQKTGIHHLAFQVADIQEWYEKMSADGVEFYFPPRERMKPGSGLYWSFFKDPDGTMIEIW
jgi:catechol 2,3-dioxygenase-like lactoylglutathione lyase family enzyme